MQIWMLSKICKNDAPDLEIGHFLVSAYPGLDFEGPGGPEQLTKTSNKRIENLGFGALFENNV